jgi:hypothetical protein
MRHEQIAAARARHDAEEVIRLRLIGEFEVTRPTPLQAENDQLGTTPGDIPMLKQWDLSPVDPLSFDPTEPPGRPDADSDAPSPPPPPPGRGGVGPRMHTVEAARAYREQAIPFAGELEVTRPTPLQEENDLLGTTSGDITLLKQWDLSPVDQQSFDPTEPPGRPVAPPVNTVLPLIQELAGEEVGDQLAVTAGTWAARPAPTLFRSGRSKRPCLPRPRTPRRLRLPARPRSGRC